MANPEHVEIVKQGAEAIREWRETNATAILELGEADLSGADLSGADLSGADLGRAHLCETNLNGADLNGADLFEAELRGADLRGANLSQADLSPADLQESNLRGADLRGADLRAANLRDADLRGADLTNANLLKSRFHSVVLDENTKLADKWRLVWHIVTEGASGEDLCGADLFGANLREANLSRADLSQADLTEADLRTANLSGADLCHAKFIEAILLGANLRETNLREANLIGAALNRATLHRADLLNGNFSEADLTGADLSEANLRGADLSGADLSEANLKGADLSGADLRCADFSDTTIYGARIGETRFDDLNLSNAKGLHTVTHAGPSTIGVDTLIESKGRIPEEFLRGCGFTPWQVLVVKLFDPALTASEIAEFQYKIFDARAHGPIYLGGVFISYSHADSKFVDKVHEQLQKEGAPVWLDRHDLTAGPLQKQVARAIRVNDVVLLVLSEASVRSDWVENELEMARKKEKEENRDVLCPVALDDSWKGKLNDTTADRQLWRTLTHKNILDFSRWKTKAFDAQFNKLLRGLKIWYEPKKD